MQLSTALITILLAAYTLAVPPDVSSAFQYSLNLAQQASPLYPPDLARADFTLTLIHSHNDC